MTSNVDFTPKTNGELRRIFLKREKKARHILKDSEEGAGASSGRDKIYNPKRLSNSKRSHSEPRPKGGKARNHVKGIHSGKAKVCSHCRPAIAKRVSQIASIEREMIIVKLNPDNNVIVN